MDLEMFLNTGTAIGLASFLPQMHRTIRNRKTLIDIPLVSQLLAGMAISCFTIFAYSNGVWLAFVMDMIQVLYSSLTILLILQGRTREISRHDSVGEECQAISKNDSCRESVDPSIEQQDRRT